MLLTGTVKNLVKKIVTELDRSRLAMLKPALLG
jgi:hypothetical protein